MNEPWECVTCDNILDTAGGGLAECPDCLILNSAIARTVHEANRAWNVHLADPAPDPPWDALPEWHQQMIIDRIILIRMGYGVTAIHEEWVEYMTGRGWQLGDVKDPASTPPTHPCLKSWSLLPREQQVKDILAIGIVKSLAG